MNRSALIRHLRKNDCFLKREGRSHSLWTNTLNQRSETIPRHAEIPNLLAKKICKNLEIPSLF